MVRRVVRPPGRRAAGGRAPAHALGAVAAAGADPRRGRGPRGGRRLGVGGLRRRRVRPGGPRILQALGGPARSGAPPLAHVPARPSGPLAARACRRPARHAAAAALLPRMAHGAGVGRPLARPGGAGLGRAPVDLGRRRPRRAAVHPPPRRRLPRGPTLFPEPERRIPNEPIIQSGFDVYLDDGKLIYVKDRCTPEDLRSRIFVHAASASPEDPPADRRGFRYERLFNAAPERFGGRCLAARSLPAYPVDHVVTGQKVWWLEQGRQRQRFLWQAAAALGAGG